MNYDEVYSGGRFLKAADLNGKTFRLVIASVELETLPGSKPKLALTFTKGDKALLANKTNASVIAERHGKDTNQWVGKAIEVYPDRTLFNGQSTPCVRVRIPPPNGADAPAAAAPPQPKAPLGGIESLENDVPW